MLIAGHPVGVTCVHPGGIKTAIARNARATAAQDQAGVAAHFDEKLAKMTPERAAEIILDGVLGDKPRVLVGHRRQGARPLRPPGRRPLPGRGRLAARRLAP